MFKLHVVQAKFGDSLILEFGAAGEEPRYVLIDGGPSGNYAANLAPALDATVAARGALELVIISHVDNDHIVGVLDLFAAMEDDDVSGREPRLRIGGLWHNSFARSVDPSGEIRERMQKLIISASDAGIAMPLATDTFFGVKEGHRIRLMAKKLKISVNDGFKDDLILAETAPASIELGRLCLRIGGPNEANLKALQREWLAWLEQMADKVDANPRATAMADKSVPNLSSLVIHATCDGKTVLLTGDARGDHILDGLKAGNIAKDGKLHVDVLKVQHHGSDRNTTRAFFDTVTAETYVISADGRYGNPDFETLRWIVESARDQRRAITLVVTNETEASRRLVKKLDPRTFGHTLTVLEPGKPACAIMLSA